MRSPAKCWYDAIETDKPLGFIFDDDRTYDLGYTPSVPWRYNAFMAWYRFFCRNHHRPTEQVLDMLKSNTKIWKYHVAMCNNIANKKRNFFLASGPLLSQTCGNGPSGAQVGDDLALIAGVSLPLILRQQGAKHRLVGFAEIESDDVMRGYLWRRIMNDRLAEFSIC